MCGIAGLIKWTHDAPPPWANSPPDRTSLEKMSAAIAHRGPDGQGVWTDPRQRITAALIHRRLAIIDLPGGAQPMSNDTEDIHVVFNGEIYNHMLLRKELQAVGHTFNTDHSDTEVLIHGWEQWGIDLPKKLLGMFAFAIWDTRDDADTLFVARDRMGQKPLFYATLEDGLVFGSTIGSVLAWPEVPRRVPKEQVGLYLLLGYLPAPQTIWRDISQLLPGGWLRVRKDVVDGGVYWMRKLKTLSIPDSGEPETRIVLTRAVHSQMMADVPIACFLSGGIDSSIVAALMQRSIRNAGGGPSDSIQTVSVGFSETAYDETAYAEAVARKINSRHTRLEVNARQDVISTLEMLIEKSLGQPFADSSILPTYHLSRAARDIAPVALSGDGADELFAGYDRYQALTMLTRAPKFLPRFMPRKLPFGSLGKKEKYRRLAAAAAEKELPEKYSRLVEIFPHDLAEELLGQSIMEYAPLPEEYLLDEHPTALRYAMLRDQQEYLPGDVLSKVDSASMAVALEVRAPFLDHFVVEFANSLHDKLLVGRGMGKLILRTTFAEELPPIVQGRPKKGFALPIGEWFKTDLRAPLTDLLLAPDSFTSAHLNKRIVQRLLDEHMVGTRDHTHRLFALLTLELWFRQFLPTIEADAVV